MAKSEKQYSFVDVDKTILEPSPQRVRNILTLEERVRAIQAYDYRPMYTKVAKMFNCSWEQIKNIIANRDAILEFYAATKTAERQANLDEIRQRKIRFLGECMYEYIQRAQFYTKADITEELLRMKAFEFRDVIQIENFMPNKVWINHFKATYNFSLSNRQITLTRTPPASLDLKDIMTYCSKNKQKTDMFQEELEQQQQQTPPVSKNLYRTTTRIAVNSANDAALQELKQRWRRKISFLEKALFEYWNRSKYHHKKRLNENSLRKVAFELKEMLKIDNFYPDNKWLNNYVTVTYPALQKQLPNNARPPPLSLDLKDILSYCSRLENKKQTPSTITLAPKEPTPQKLWNVAPASQPTPTPIVLIHTLNLRRDDNTATQQQQQSAQQQQHQNAKTSMESQTKIKEEIIDLGDDELLDIKPNLIELAAAAAVAPTSQTAHIPATTERPQTQTQRRKREREEQENTNGNANVETKGKETLTTAQPQPLKIRKIETINKDAMVATLTPTTAATAAATATAAKSNAAVKTTVALATTAAKAKEASANEMPQHSPGHWSEYSDRDEEELPKHVRSYNDALKLLRPLEEFAMLEENYRVIGLIGQLEDIFKNPPKKRDSN